MRIKILLCVLFVIARRNIKSLILLTGLFHKKGQKMTKVSKFHGNEWLFYFRGSFPIIKLVPELSTKMDILFHIKQLFGFFCKIPANFCSNALVTTAFPFFICRKIVWSMSKSTSPFVEANWSKAFAEAKNVSKTEANSSLKTALNLESAQN